MCVLRVRLFSIVLKRSATPVAYSNCNQSRAQSC
jgi:hypothetical protein